MISNHHVGCLLSGSVHAAKEDPEQREVYEELVAMKRYHRRFGKVNESLFLWHLLCRSLAATVISERRILASE